VRCSPSRRALPIFSGRIPSPNLSRIRYRLGALNLLLLEPGEIERESGDGVAVIRGRRARHVERVLRAGAGDEVRVGVVGGGVGTAVVRRIEAERLELVIGALSAPPPAPPVDLVLALPRPKAVGRVLQAAASLGVRRLDLVNAWRVDKTYFASHRLEGAALVRELWLGCEQGAHTHVPEVEVHPLLMPFVRELLAARAGARRVLIFDPRARMRLEDVMAPGTREPVVALIGPEGGWIDREVEAFERIGGTPVTLTAAVLRTEVAVTAALSQLELLRRLPADLPPR
jgi:16S rRNA (uracil1498-N3)-methyltransferase